MLVELILAMVAWAAPAASPAEPAPLPQAIPTRQTAFSIPFHIQHVQELSAEPVEVQLYVSTDRGASWRLSSRVDPRQGRFPFHAGGDGEYWFLMRTLDRSGQVRPQGEARPGLRVIVDTTPPKLHLEARAVDNRRLMARWQIEDSYPNLESLKIQYRTSPTQPWQSVAIDRMGQTSGPIHGGEVSWLSQEAADHIEIRAEMADTAGNPAVSHAQVDLTARMVAAAKAETPPVNAVATSNPAPAHVTPPASSDWQTAQAPVSAAAPATQWTAATPRGVLPNGSSATSMPANTDQASNSGPVNIQIHPALRKQYTGSAEPTPADRAAPTIPPGVRPRMVNSRVFELDYNVDTVGPSGIARVELWGTRDGGRTWSSFGQDNDRSTPMMATANEDGLYGFRVCVQNGVGLGGGPPQSGQAPDVWIGVDRAKPEIHIVSATQGAGEQSGRLLIRWEARDWVLIARPVSLYYSATMGGPWTPIVAGLEATGQYNWLVEGRVPERIFLRAEARDEAGNLGIHELPQPVVLDKLRPSGRIQEVRAVGR